MMLALPPPPRCAAKFVGLRLLDHLVVTEDGWVSLRAEGVLK
jgi:DNA repair protein RadC